MKFSYAKAGVDVDKVKGIQVGIADLIKSTETKDVVMGAGHYAALFRFGGKTLAMHVDQVGTKVLIAEALRKYDTVGIDAIAMNVNDIVCLGARPIACVDYLAVRKSNYDQILQIMSGIVAGAKEAKCAVLGGETAIVPELLRGGDNAFDLSITCFGELEGKTITGSEMKAGDVIIGIASSGIHSNGYTLARRVLLKGRNASNADRMKEMLTPTKIYSNVVLDVIGQVPSVHGLAHITGGAFSKLQRIGKYAKKGFVLDNMPQPLPIFKLIQEEGRIDDREMYRTFNMGIGFCIVCNGADAEKVISICKKHDFKAQKIGSIIPKEGVYLKKGGKTIDLS